MTYNDLCGVSAYISIDIETTGLECETNEIIEIAALKYVNECIIGEYVTFVAPSVRLSSFITELTGITDEMLSDAPRIEDVIPEFVEFIGDFPLVAHNSKFDMSFLQKYSRQVLGREIINPVIDTLRLSRELLPNLKNHKLVTVKECLGIRSDALHRAKADAYVCGEIIKKMIAYVRSEMTKTSTRKEKVVTDVPSPTDRDKSAITVSQLNKYIKNLIERDTRLFDVPVKGEISNYKRHSSGHLYMTLKDENGAVRAIMFRGDASKLRFEPENGMKVIVKGRVSVFERDGQYQLYLTEMQPDGVGDLYVAFEQLKEKLRNEGLFDEKYKKPLPRFPKAVGVVTSPTGAAVRDIINVITRRYPMCEIIIYPAQVQGDTGSKTVEEGIECFNRMKNVDVIIAGRGGGSIEELWVFNEERTARAIFKSEIPVISAVGHETDFTIADFVADLRAPTPSAAAELTVPSAEELRYNIESNFIRMRRAVAGTIENKRNILKRFALKSPTDYINYNIQRLDMLSARLADNAKARLDEFRHRFALEAGRLNALSPLSVIERGYSVAQKKDGSVIRSVDVLKENDMIITTLADGTVESVVTGLKKKPE